METNKIYLGNAYELIKEIPDKSIDLIYTDIPYLFKGCAKKPTLEKNMGGRIKKNISDLVDANITDGIDYKILDEFVRVCKTIYVYIWCSKDQIYDIMKYFIEGHNCSCNILCWCKTNCIPAVANNWLPNIEYCLVFKGKGSPKYNDGYEIKSKYFISSINKADKQKFDHPTIKPLDLVERHLLHSTNEGDVVLDPFIGSGTTAIACKHLNRKYIGFEINEKFYKIATDRLEGWNQRGQMNLLDL